MCLGGTSYYKIKSKYFYFHICFYQNYILINDFPKTMRILLAILITASCLGCNSKDNCSCQKPIDVNDGLHVSTLEAHKLDTAIFDKINQDICNGKYENIKLPSRIC